MRFRVRTLIAGGAILLLPVLPLGAVEEITAEDADGVERVLNGRGRVTVIIYSNESLQDWTREAGASLDRFQGRADFRSMVVVDLRGSLAHWAKGYTQRRMQRDLDKEAERVRPHFRKNGNTGDPREAVVAIADFDGEVSRALGWEKKSDDKRVVVFDREGRAHRSWESMDDFSELQSGVRSLLDAAPGEARP